MCVLYIYIFLLSPFLPSSLHIPPLRIAVFYTLPSVMGREEGMKGGRGVLYVLLSPFL